jgi:predicted MFS family arabinose efflux permease
LISSLLTPTVTRRLDRRWVLLSFSALVVLSNLLVAFAPGFGVLLVGRLVLGIAHGGFWGMAAATAMRLVSAASVPRALSVMFAGLSIANIAVGAIGSYLGSLIGWRNVFLVAGALAALAFVLQMATLPSMPPNRGTRLGTLVQLLGRPVIATAMVAIVCVFAGHYAFFTYLRPFLETATGVGVAGLSAVLLGFGVANFFGTSLTGFLPQRGLRSVLVLMPLLMSLLALGFAVSPHLPWLTFAMVAIWGLAAGVQQIGWNAWVTRTVPQEAESAGGLLVASMQFAISIGAAAGGFIFDRSGIGGVFTGCSIVLLAAVLIIAFGVMKEAAHQGVRQRAEA